MFGHQALGIVWSSMKFEPLIKCELPLSAFAKKKGSSKKLKQKEQNL